MKVYQPCYYNGQDYDFSLEVDSNCIYKDASEAIKEIEKYGVFNTEGKKYKYSKYSWEKEKYDNLIFPVIKYSVIKLHDEFHLDIHEEGYAYIKVFELK